MKAAETMITTAIATGNAAISTSKTVFHTTLAIATSREAKATYRFTFLMAQLAFWGAVWLGATTIEAGQRFRCYYEHHHQEWVEATEVVATTSIKVAKTLWAAAQVTAENSKATTTALKTWLSKAVEFTLTLKTIAEIEARVRAQAKNAAIYVNQMNPE